MDAKDFYVYASVTPVGENNTARGNFTKVSNEDWTQSTIAFSGEGLMRITISDYYFCELTTVYVIVGNEQTQVAKFKEADAVKPCYNTETEIKIGELFEAVGPLAGKAAIQDEKVEVTVTPLGGEGTVDAAYEADDTDWTQGTLMFSVNGVYVISITDNSNCMPTTMIVSVEENTCDWS